MEARGCGRRPSASRIGGHDIAALAALPLAALGRTLDAAVSADDPVAGPLLASIHERLAVLDELGLSHLQLDRSAPSLSEGERNRIRLATQLCGGLSGATFVLDEPSAGLHPEECRRLIGVLTRLRDRGNSVLVVEHDEQIVRAADWIVELGPAAGLGGGELVYSGPLAGLLADDTLDSPTRRQLLSADERRATRPRRDGDGTLVVRGARARNLQEIDARFRRGAFNVVCGLSGAGKSTLVTHTLARALRARLHGAHDRPGAPRGDRGRRGLRQDHRRRQQPHRTDAALEPGHLHEALRRRARALRPGGGGSPAGLRQGPLLLQHGRRTLRALRGRRRPSSWGCTTCPTPRSPARPAAGAASTPRR